MVSVLAVLYGVLFSSSIYLGIHYFSEGEWEKGILQAMLFLYLVLREKLDERKKKSNGSIKR